MLFENVVRADGTRSDMPVLVNLFGTVERVAWGMDREPDQLREVGETAGLPAPARAAAAAGARRWTCCRWLQTVLAMKPQDREQRARARRSC